MIVLQYNTKLEKKRTLKLQKHGVSAIYSQGAKYFQPVIKNYKRTQLEADVISAFRPPQMLEESTTINLL